MGQVLVETQTHESYTHGYFHESLYEYSWVSATRAGL